MIREAVAAELADEVDEATQLARQRSAMSDACGSVPRLPDGAAYTDEVRGADRARDEHLEER